MVPHVGARRTHQRLEEFSFAAPKRLLQQYLPQAEELTVSTMRPLCADVTTDIALG